MTKAPIDSYTARRHKMDFINRNIDPKKLFVSNNTIGVAQ